MVAPIRTTEIANKKPYFRMGDIQGAGESDEQPVHSVSVGQFAMGKFDTKSAKLVCRQSIWFIWYSSKFMEVDLF